MAVILVGVALLRWVAFPHWLELVGIFGLGLAAWWWIASIVASFWIYDASGLTSWSWLAGITAPPSGAWVNFHAGLDESTPELTALWGPPKAVIDFFDGKEMTEPSIKEARSIAHNLVPATAASYRALPFPNATISLAVVAFAAHELRSSAARELFFEELARILEPGGSLLIIEHLRDAANFAAFGPGFMHFLPHREWLRVARFANLTVVSQVRKTPFTVGISLCKR